MILGEPGDEHLLFLLTGQFGFVEQFPLVIERSRGENAVPTSYLFGAGYGRGGRQIGGLRRVRVPIMGQVC